jgi:four helix bundle protein
MMTFAEWVTRVPKCISDDDLWHVKAYRLGLFVADIGWADVTKLSRDRRTIGLSDQLCRSLAGISSTIAEGYSRSTGKERARYYEFALGSARESRDHYFKGRYILGDAVVEHRLKVLTRIVQLTLKMIPDQRRKNIKLSY